MSKSERGGRIDYAGSRTFTQVGDATGITVPKKELRDEYGIDAEDLRGESTRCTLEDGRLIVEIPTDERS